MDVSQVTSFPVYNSNRASVGKAQNYVQAPPAAPNFISSKTDTPTTDISKTIDIHEAPSADRLAQAVKQVNDSFSQRGQNLYVSFEKDKITGINVVKIVDKKTNETISQMPPKELVKFAQVVELPQGGRGQLIHDKA